MKNIYLTLVLVLGLFSTQGWAPPIKGGATGGAEAAPDISKCDLNPSKQTKVKVKDKDGKDHFICTGQAVCGGKSVPVSCKVSEREPCPTAKQCIVYKEVKIFPGEINCCYLKRNPNFSAAVTIVKKNNCSDDARPQTGERIGFQYLGTPGSPERIAIKTRMKSTYHYPGGENVFIEDVCFELKKGASHYFACNIPFQQNFVPTIEWSTDTYEARRGRPRNYPGDCDR